MGVEGGLQSLKNPVQIPVPSVTSVIHDGGDQFQPPYLLLALCVVAMFVQDDTDNSRLLLGRNGGEAVGRGQGHEATRPRPARTDVGCSQTKVRQVLVSDESQLKQNLKQHLSTA